MFADKGDAQTVAVVPQRGVGLLQRERGGSGGHPQTVQHQGEGPQHHPGFLARAALVLVLGGNGQSASRVVSVFLLEFFNTATDNLYENPSLPEFVNGNSMHYYF